MPLRTAHHQNGMAPEPRAEAGMQKQRLVGKTGEDDAKAE